MSRVRFIISFYLLISPFTMPGQCPEQPLLKGRLAYLKDSSGSPVLAQLKTLRSYESLARQCGNARDTVRIMVLQKLANLSQSNQDYVQATNYSRQAIQIIQGNQWRPAINPVFQIRNYYNLAISYRLLKKTAEEFRAFDSCVAIALRSNIVNLHSMYSLSKEVERLNDLGDYKTCIRKAELGEALSHRYVVERGLERYGDSTEYACKFVVQKVNALLILNEIKDAERFLLEKIKACENTPSRKFLGTFYELLAMAKMQNEAFADAKAYFNRALSFHLLQKDTFSYKTTVFNAGYYLYTKTRGYENDSMALLQYAKALNCKMANLKWEDVKEDSINTLNIYVSMAAVYVRRQRFDSAQYYFKKAFSQFKFGANEEVVLNSSADEFSEKVEYFTGLFIDKANAYYREFKTTNSKAAIDEAIKIYKCTDRLLERIKKSQLELQSKLFWRKNTHHFYEQAIEACMASGKLKDAFYFFERSRAILLFDQMHEQSMLVQADIERRRELTDKLRKIQNGLDHLTPGSVNFDNMQVEQMTLKAEQDNLNQQIKEKNLLYYQNFIDSSSTSLNEVRKIILKHHKALVEIFEGDSSVYAMIVTSSNIFFNKIAKKNYDKTLQQCIAYLSNSRLSNNDNEFDEFTKNSLYLYNLIFQDKKIPDGRIVISTDGHSFPFEVLITGFENKEPVYFLQTHAVSYTYSARYLMSQFVARPSSHPKDFLGVAPVTFPAKEKLPGLSGSDEAIKSDKAIFDESDILLMGDATKANFVKRFSQYQILQLYSHSSDSSARGEPLIYFADQPLYMSELNEMEMPATKLVVLSACKTGNGQYYQGEGVFSFNRAFAGLGIPSCINNLWSVNNEATYKITHMFYENLDKGMAIDEALQQAKLAFIKLNAGSRKRHPYYWAATILAGKSDAIQFNGNHPFRIVMIALAVAAFIALAWPLTIFLNKERKRRALKT